MTFLAAIRTLFEILLFAVVVWGIFNEDKWVAFEKKLFSKIRRRRLKVVKSSRPTYKAGI